jgi:DNA-binding transcriptional regulator GbsR (MarR family)
MNGLERSRAAARTQTPKVARTVVAEDVGLQIVLFGAAGAGKSSLLGALAQAAQTQPEVLGSQLTDTSGALAELQKKTYDNKQTETLEEVVAYPVTLQTGETVPATLIDCDGRAAQDYLDGKRSLEDNARLASAVKEADALVLAVAPGDNAQLEQAFSQATQFLRLFEQQRGRRSEIAGLPVYLVLTKCDLLARKDDTGSSWIQRIEEGKRKIGKRFQDFLETRRTVPFGSIDLRLWATAVKRPPLTDKPARPTEPYGVAELFRQVIDSARAFHEQRTHARRRLRLVVIGLVAVIGVMGVVAGGFFLTRPGAEMAALENAIRAALPTAAGAERLREPLEPRVKELHKILENPEFARLPSKSQDEVQQALRELQAYQALGKTFDALKRVRFFKAEEELEANARAADKIAFPSEYASQWADTRLARKIKIYKNELAALGQALAEETAWLKKQIDEGEKLRKMAIPAEGSAERQAWLNRADAFLKRKDLTKDVPGVPNMKFRDLYEFPTVSSLREDYETVRPRVDKIRGGLSP